MDKKPPKPMTPFDEMIISPHLQMMKLCLPYTPASNQKSLGIMIKFMEFQQTIQFFQSFDSTLHSQALRQSPVASPLELFQDLKPYLPPSAVEMADSFVNMMSMMEMMQTFQEGAEEQEGAGNATNSENSGMNPMNMVMGMLTPEQQNMFEMYNTMFSNETSTTTMEGDNLDERMDEPPGNEEP